jgi:hypothetical protein
MDIVQRRAIFALVEVASQDAGNASEALDSLGDQVDVATVKYVAASLSSASIALAQAIEKLLEHVP